VHGIEHIAPTQIRHRPDVADDLGGLFDVPCEQFAGSHFFALASGAMVHDAEFIMRHEKGRGMKKVVGLFSLRRAIHRKFWIR